LRWLYLLSSIFFILSYWSLRSANSLSRFTLLASSVRDVTPPELSVPVDLLTSFCPGTLLCGSSLGLLILFASSISLLNWSCFDGSGNTSYYPLAYRPGLPSCDGNPLLAFGFH
jgi:hypothetical protein